MTQLVRYEAMRSAIAVCHSVDEIKDLHDKALALELYTRQARDFDAERKAADIRLRAERRAGELLKDLARTPSKEVARAGGAAKAEKLLPATVAASSGDSVVREAVRGVKLASPQQRSPYREAIERAGIPERTAQRWQDLAKIPEKEFEAVLADPACKPTTARLIQQIRDPIPKIDEASLTLWGIAWAFEREKHFNIDIPSAVAGMSPEMRANIRPLLPRIVSFINKFSKELSHERT